MKTLKLGTILGAAMVAAFANAQSSGPSGFSLRIGAAFADGGSVFSFGGDYKISQISVAPTSNGYNTYLGFSADYYGRNSAYNIPLAFTYNVRANQALFHVGLGLDITQFAGKTETGLGFQLGAQYDFAAAGSNSTPLYASLKYFFARENNLNALQAALGYRF